MTSIDADTLTAPFPALTHTNLQVAHLTDDGKQTRCGTDCSRWASDRYETMIHGKQCARCGNAADYAAVLTLSYDRAAAREAARLENQRQFTLRQRAENTKRREIEKIVEAALREHGYDIEIEPVAFSTRIFAFVDTGYEQVAFQVAVNESAGVANRVRAKQQSDGQR